MSGLLNLLPVGRKVVVVSFGYFVHAFFEARSGVASPLNVKLAAQIAFKALYGVVDLKPLEGYKR